MASQYKPLTDEARSNCIRALRQALMLAEQAQKLYELAGQVAVSVISALEAEGESPPDASNKN